MSDGWERLENSVSFLELFVMRVSRFGEVCYEDIVGWEM